MTIAITYSIISSNPAVRSTTGTNVHVVPTGYTVEDLANDLLPGEYEADVKVNYEDVEVDTELQNADHVSIEVALPTAAPVAAAAAPYAAPAQSYGTIQFLFLNADSTGFATNKTIAAGTLLAQFIVEAGYNDLARWVIRVNNEPVGADYVIKNGDKVAMFPSKVEGAVETISVLFIDARANAAGFAPQRTALAGITLKQFLQQQLQSADVTNMIIRVNNNPALESYVLANGDKVSLFPSKVEGAK